MAISNRDRVSKAMDLLKEGLAPFVEREMSAALKEGRGTEIARKFAEDQMTKDTPISEWDSANLLRLMWESWNEVFRQVLGPAERGLVGELRGVRNNWAHQKAFSSDDTDRALDSTERLLNAVSASEQAEQVAKLKMELRRLVVEEQSRSDRRRGGSAIEARGDGTLKPWREVVEPHPDVASGRYQQAEFAADLWQVHMGGGSPEYRDPVEFYRRTYLTDSLSSLLTTALHRLGSGRGDPVVQLQTNFGGGKTHSMLALYHLVSGAQPGEMVGVESLMTAAEVDTLPEARRVVLVGNKMSPGNPWEKEDGTVVRTLWGELAWQLGGAAAYAKIKADDERGTSPGDKLRELMDDCGPCLILIDEWVAYARQLHDSVDLPGGNFETHFSFAQALTESARLAKNCLLVISLPASDTATSGDDEEVGGERGRAALARLRNVIGRLESSWSPARPEEGFEIVRRRLFLPMNERSQHAARDATARAFYDFYREQANEFPAETRDPDYERRIKVAYPVHPEVFDRLYTDWSSLVKFQRTRGVLRLMAAVIHSLWESGDRNPLILPANLPIDDPRVRDELTRYLSDNWKPILEKDVDGPNSLPVRLDGENANLGRYSACRRVARTIYLGSAPTAGVSNRGMDDRRIKLGSVMPGDSCPIFGDAMRRLAGQATYLYNDGTRYWYDTQPTVTKLAEDRAAEMEREPDKVAKELDDRMRENLRSKGSFAGVHAFPASGADVPDDPSVRLVVLSSEHSYTKEPECAAMVAARKLLESRGNAPRIYRNALVFLASDAARLQSLDESVRRYLAWGSILNDENELNLSPHQVRQARDQLQTADAAVKARLPETFQWLLVPDQPDPQGAMKIEASRLSGTDALAERASKKLRAADGLYVSLGGTVLRHEIDRVPLWRGPSHIPMRQLIEDFATYLYLPRLRDPQVLLDAVADGVASLTWVRDAFAIADSFDETEGRYRGLRAGSTVSLTDSESQLLVVHPEVARKQIEHESAAAGDGSEGAEPTGGSDGAGGATEKQPGDAPSGPQGKPEKTAPTRFHGSVSIDPTRTGRDAGRIAEELIAHLNALPGAEVSVQIEISARLPQGAPEHTVRTVTENARTLGFGEGSGFENE